MGFRRSDLQEAFFVPGTYAFRVYGYGTTDSLEEVLAPGYFAHGTGLLRPGDDGMATLSWTGPAPTCAPCPRRRSACSPWVPASPSAWSRPATPSARRSPRGGRN